MSLEQEDLKHLIASDLDLRNRNWTKIEQQLDRLDQYIDELENTYNKRIIDKGSKTEGNSSHFYEIYADGTAKAWGVVEVTLDITTNLAGLYRAPNSVSFDNMIDFIRNDQLVILTNITGTSNNDSFNSIPMSVNNSNNPFQVRILQVSSTARTDVTLRLHYQITGEPNV